MTDSGKGEYEELLRNRSLAFFGAITASVSHELNNVISIINQNAGLLDDLIIGSRKGRPIDEERLGRLADTVKRQTERGITIIRRLNTFAHSVDEPVREFDIGEVASNIVELMQRLAGLKRSSIDLVKPDQPLMMTGNPFMVRQVLYLAMSSMLCNVEEDEPVEVRVESGEEGIRLLVSCRSARPSEEGDHDYLDMMLVHLGGKVSSTDDGATLTIDIFLPIEPS